MFKKHYAGNFFVIFRKRYYKSFLCVKIQLFCFTEVLKLWKTKKPAPTALISAERFTVCSAKDSTRVIRICLLNKSLTKL